MDFFFLVENKLNLSVLMFIIILGLITMMMLMVPRILNPNPNLLLLLNGDLFQFLNPDHNFIDLNLGNLI